MPQLRPAVALAAALTICSATSYGQARATQVADLQRLVFGMGDPSFPDTPEKLEAQLQLADVYARGDGIDQDPELACGLAMAARFALSANEREDGPVYEQTRRTERRLCAGVRDPLAAVQVASCPKFGLEPRTLALGSGGLLVVSRSGWTIEDRTGLHDGEWPINCGDVVASIRLTHVPPPGGSTLASRTFVELLIWHQSHRTDGTVGDRSLDWQLFEHRAAAGDLRQAESVSVAQDSRASIWPLPPIPDAAAAGARFRMLRNGEIKWWFDEAPEIGAGTIAAR